jgi:hypothetical protein
MWIIGEVDIEHFFVVSNQLIDYGTFKVSPKFKQGDLPLVISQILQVVSMEQVQMISKRF